MKKSLLLVLILCIVSGVCAYEYVPKSATVNPFADKAKNNQQNEQTTKPKMREIKNLTEYFDYLPAEVHRHWKPFHSKTPYEVTVQFRIKRDGTISDLKISESTNKAADNSVLEAVKAGAPYQHLPASYPNKDGVFAQIILEYKPNQN